jgi:hypothetical protein
MSCSPTDHVYRLEEISIMIRFVQQPIKMNKEANTMRRRKTRSVVVVIITTLLLTMSGFQAVAQERKIGEKISGEAMAADLVLLRPLGFAATAIGTVLFAASLPFSAMGGNAKGAFDTLVGEPGAFTFARPLGKVEQ